MPYFTAGNVKRDGERVVLAAAAARTANGSGASFFMGGRDTLRLDLSITAAGGTTPTLNVKVQHSADGNTWTDLASFTQATGASSQRKVLSGCDRYVKATWTIGGTTPSFTFGLDGEAV